MRTRGVTYVLPSPLLMSKPAKTLQEQLVILKSRGLNVPDEPFALHVLEHHNYYRLSAYRFPFIQPGQPDVFRPGASFTDLWQLYDFDRALRLLVMDACQQVEISVRSRWAYVTGHQLGPLAYLNNAHFSDALIHARTLTKLDAEMSRSREEFIRHHRTVLAMPWPPAWVIAEVASFGNTSNLISQLRQPALRQAIADPWQFDETVFCSLLHHLCYLRNVCAHHSRLWNRGFTITFQLPRRKPPHLHPNFHRPPGPQGPRRIHNSLILLLHLLETIDPATPWPRQLLLLLRTLPAPLLLEMGFPPDWQLRPLWSRLAALYP